jgi:acetylornithine/N-succinyldiaminopimelate aminotransferase
MPEGFRHVAYGDLEALEIAADPAVCSAVLFEVVEGEGGVIPMPPGFLTEVRRICDERGILLMLDEVQTGLGRTGRWFACHHEGVVPDVVTMAKSLGNGVPVGACWARPEVAAVFEPGDHGSTFGGQPLAMAAARATLETLIDIDAPECARQLAEQLTGAVSELPGVAYVRGLGALLGAVLFDGLDAGAIVADCLQHGLIVNTTSPGVIRLLPPYIASEADCDEAVEILDGALRRALVASGQDVPV